jgi:hypothetical protein
MIFKKIDLKSYRHGARWRWLWRLFRFYFWTGNNGNTKENIVTRHPLELIIFSDEEGSLLGSKALAEHLIKELSQSGLTVGEGIDAIGGKVDSISSVMRKKVLAF